MRQASRRCDIAYEFLDGSVAYDDIPDPLPFDVNAPVIEIPDEFFGVWYMDCMDDMKKYDGKTVHFKGMVALDKRFPKGMIAVGRFVMTCCEADTQYMSFLCNIPSGEHPAHKDWLEVTAKVAVKNHPLYKGVGPVLTATAFSFSLEPITHRRPMISALP